MQTVPEANHECKCVNLITCQAGGRGALENKGVQSPLHAHCRDQDSPECFYIGYVGMLDLTYLPQLLLEAAFGDTDLQ